MSDRTVPYIYHEYVLARKERMMRRLWLSSLVLFLAFMVSNVAWLAHCLF